MGVSERLMGVEDGKCLFGNCVSSSKYFGLNRGICFFVFVFFFYSADNKFFFLLFALKLLFFFLSKGWKCFLERFTVEINRAWLIREKKAVNPSLQKVQRGNDLFENIWEVIYYRVRSQVSWQNSGILVQESDIFVFEPKFNDKSLNLAIPSSDTT